MNAFIYFFYELMASHAVTFSAEQKLDVPSWGALDGSFVQLR